VVPYFTIVTATLKSMA